MGAIQQSDLRAMWNEIARLQEQNRQLREKIATTWDLAVERLSGWIAGDNYGSYETCAADTTWYDFTNISASITTLTTCDIAIVCHCRAYAYSSTTLRLAEIRPKLNALTGTLSAASLRHVDAESQKVLTCAYTFANIAAGTQTAKMQRYVSSQTTDTRFFTPSLVVIAVPVHT